MHVRTWQAAYGHVFGDERLGTLSVETRRAGWERILADEDSSVFVALDGDSIAGFVSVGRSRDADAEGELYGIYADPSAWGGLTGRELMRTALDELRGLGYRDAVLWVLEDNPRARRFYEREGWVPDGAEKEDEFLGVTVQEVRYRIAL